MPETIIVTELEYRKGEAVFRETGDLAFVPAPTAEGPLAAAVQKERARAVIVGVERYTGPLYDALHKVAEPRPALIARFGVGHDGIDKPLAQRHNILVANTPGALDLSVAEHALWLMGALARQVPRVEARFRQGEFAGETGAELHGQCLGVLGFGQIGRRVASIAHYGFGMHVLACDVTPVEQLERHEQQPLGAFIRRWGLELYTTDLDRGLRECDFLSVHLPALPATRHFINGQRLRLMKPTAFLVNTSRGSVLDEAALFDALAAGRLGGAGLDVFEREPYQPVVADKDLRQLPNVVLTPHIASNTLQANRRMAERCVDNIHHFLAGEIERIARVDNS